MTQGKSFLAAGVIVGALVVGAIAAFFVRSSDGDGGPSATVEATSSSVAPNGAVDFEVTLLDLASMTLDEQALSLVSPAVTTQLILSSQSGALSDSPLNSEGVRHVSGAAGWTETYNLDGIRDAPPAEHRGLFRASMQVFLFDDDRASQLEFTQLVLGLDSGTEPTAAGTGWDAAVFNRATRDAADHSEYSSIVMFRVGPVLAFSSLASTVDESLEADAVSLARAFADQIRAVLSDLRGQG